MAGAAIAVAVRKARREIVDHFVSAGATAPERAVAYDAGATGVRHRRIHDRLFRRMQTRDVLREAQPGRFYLDRDRLADYAASMRRRAFGLMALAAGAGALAFAFGG